MPAEDVAHHVLPTPADLAGTDRSLLARNAEGARRVRAEVAARRAGETAAGGSVVAAEGPSNEPQSSGDAPADGPTPSDLKRRNAFGRVPKPSYFGVDPESFSDVTPEERAAIDVSHCFRRRLFGVKGGESLNGLALNPDEYEAIVRHPGAFATAIAAKTDAARTLDKDGERRGAAVDRSVEHAIEAKATRADKVIQGLNAEERSLARLLKEMRSPGYAHMSEADMRILLTTARSSFDNMLSVVAKQADWSPNQRERAKKAMNSRLFDSDYRSAFSYWQELTQMAKDYTHSKSVLFGQRKRAAERTATRR